MKAWLKDIKGMWVVTYAEGRMLGTVHGIYLDAPDKKVTGFLIRTGSPLSGEDLWIGVDRVRKLGEDLIFLDNEAAAEDAEPRGERLAQLVNKPVSGKDGRALGQLTDVAVDTETWLIEELALGQDHRLPVVLAETVLGDDLILVQAGAEPSARTDGRKRENLVHTVLGKDFVKQTSDALRRVLKGAEARLSPRGGEPRPPSEAAGKEDQSEEPPQ